ncbi:hypothetical protein HPB51_014169 [Rhipicephalus microplus]|uniref:Uncharacterized protein n=1 Tax=Rhipicephalus microplus TaxID=6941 RepID=A0A9J6E1T0_RHIMP|nr:hypothetical protein HPB51_014169 [Rhipicephalus microplus]
MFSSRRFPEDSSGMKMMTCGQRPCLDFIVSVLSEVCEAALTIFLFALLLRTGMKSSSDESSSEQIKNSVQGSHTVFAIGLLDNRAAFLESLFDTIKTVVNTFAADTVIAVSSVNQVPSTADCNAIPPNIYSAREEDRNAALTKFWPLLLTDATTRQAKTLGLSFEMGTLYYELEDPASDIVESINKKCRASALTSRDAYQLASQNGTIRLRSRVAWMLFNVHLEDVRKHCGREPYEPEQTFCDVFLEKTC